MESDSLVTYCWKRLSLDANSEIGLSGANGFAEVEMRCFCYPVLIFYVEECRVHLSSGFIGLPVIFEALHQQLFQPVDVE